MKNKYHKVDNVQSFYSCVDGCTHLVVAKWSDMEGVDISFVDSNLVGQGYSSIWGRIKRAWHTLIDKPIYYSTVILPSTEVARLTFDLNRILIAELNEEAENQMPLPLL